MSRGLHTATSGALLASTPVPWAVTVWAHADPGESIAPWIWALPLTASVALALGALLIVHRARWGRPLATAGWLSTLGIGAPGFLTSPGLTVVLAIASAFTMANVWRIGAPLFFSAARGEEHAGRVRGSAAIASGFWLVVSIGAPHPSTIPWIAVGASNLFAMGLGARWAVRHRRLADPRSRTLAIALATCALLATFMFDDLPALVSCGVIYSLVALLFGPDSASFAPASSRWWTTILEHPERILVSTFATLAAIGAILLALPLSAVDGDSIGGIDAVFTAVSAVCVTGLIVRDTPHEFSAFGLGVILMLIQLGGLGIMTFSTAALRVLGGRMSFRQEAAVARLIGAKDRSRVMSSAQDVLRVTLWVETIGAVILTALFLAEGEDLSSALWRGSFTAVSAYCNAGFALQSDSLISYQTTSLVLHVVAVMIILGGLSPAIILALRYRRSSNRPLAVQSKVCIFATAGLLLVGFMFYTTLEWDASLAGLTVGQKLHNAWFQSATLRTAGFNSVDVSAVHPGTYVLMLCWMFIGGCPGGTAGGVKTTTVALLALSVFHTIRGRSTVTLFGRRLPDRAIQRAAVIVTVTFFFSLAATVALSVTQRIPLEMIIFEVTSALGTVGLSQGATNMLDGVGKIIVIGCMFVGRIGGLTLMMVMGHRSAHHRIGLPVESMDVG